MYERSAMTVAKILGFDSLGDRKDITMNISIKVTAGAKKEGIEVLPNNRFKISVRAKAEQGAANKRVLELIALHFRVPIKKVHIVRGHHSPLKIVLIGH